ncbi:MAG: hypothetical protein KGS61_04140 [Verrucomicrobia bacterium]|nr:hypothetical protein [Verrucomicrobiota bacterium]
MNADNNTWTATNISSNTHINRTMSISITMVTIAAAITTVNQADTACLPDSR